MTIILNVSPEAERLLQQKAAQEGLSLEDYLREIVERHVQTINGTPEVGQRPPADFDDLLDQLSEGLPPVTTLPADWSRDQLYAGSSLDLLDHQDRNARDNYGQYKTQ